MARFTAEGPLSYEKACVLISDLRKNGIEANITAGGGIAVSRAGTGSDRRGNLQASWGWVLPWLL
jgi:hypothetical protein